MDIITVIIILIGILIVFSFAGLVSHANPARKWDVAISLLTVILGSMMFVIFLIVNIHIQPCNKIKTENQVCVIKVIPIDKE